MLKSKQKRLSDEQVVAALYRAAFNRDPEPEGLKNHRSALATGTVTLDQLAHTIFHADEHKIRLRGEFALDDKTQFGELVHILKQLVLTGSQHQLIVDVGARGRQGSNSFNLLSDFGWKGLLIEANPMLIDSIHQEFEGLNFEIVNCAVGEQNEIRPFYIGVNDDVSSLLPDHAQVWGELRGSVEVVVRRLADILDEHDVPNDFDILSLDIEGLDVRVLNDLVENSAYRPRIVVIEASYDFATKTMFDAGLSEKVCSLYELAGQTKANLILVASRKPPRSEFRLSKKRSGVSADRR